MRAVRQTALFDPGRRSDRPLRDLRLLRRFISGPAPAAVFDAPWAPVFFLALFLLHPLFGLWAAAGALTLLGVSFLNQAVASGVTSEAEHLERMASYRAGELVNHAEVLRSMGMEQAIEARWLQIQARSGLALSGTSRLLSLFTSGTKAFRLFLQSAILGLGAFLAIRGEVSPGAMIAASILMGRAIAPIEQVVGQWRSVVNAREAWVSLRKAIAEAPAVFVPMQLPPAKGAVRLEQVYAGPPGQGKSILQGVDLTAGPGDVIGVIGPSAAGKSTLARVLAGIWRPLSGHVRLDGADLDQYPVGDLGRQIGYLPQQVDLMAGTVRENVCRFQPDIAAEEVVRAARSAACHDMITGFEKGYETEIGPGGAYLSAGQRQRIGLARALFGSPRLIILDEPNSNLDPEGEEALQRAITSLRESAATTFIIAHRPGALAYSNKILVLENGKVRAFGPRDEVLSKVLPAGGRPGMPPNGKG